MDIQQVRLQEFDGEPDKWADWSFAFERIVRSMDPDAYKLMMDTEVLGSDMCEIDDLDSEQD